MQQILATLVVVAEERQRCIEGIRGGEGAGRGEGTAVVPRSPPPPPRSALILAVDCSWLLDMLRAEVITPETKLSS